MKHKIKVWYTTGEKQDWYFNSYGDYHNLSEDLDIHFRFDNL